MKPWSHGAREPRQYLRRVTLYPNLAREHSYNRIIVFHVYHVFRVLQAIHISPINQIMSEMDMIINLDLPDLPDLPDIPFMGPLSWPVVKDQGYWRSGDEWDEWSNSKRPQVSGDSIQRGFTARGRVWEFAEPCVLSLVSCALLSCALCLVPCALCLALRPQRSTPR